MFLGPDGRPVPERSLVGPLAAGTPGSPVGLFELHRRFGRLPWRRVVTPAIHLALRGFKVNARLHAELEAGRELLSRFPETAAVWLPHGRVPAEGTLIRLPRLGAALQAYAERGPQALTGGAAAAAIERTVKKHGGVLTAADLAGYRAVWRVPVRFQVAGWAVASMPLPSSGGIILGQTAGVLERLGWASLPADSVERDHLLVEAWRRAFADRVLLGDPATTRASEADLLAPSWLDRCAAGVDRSRATASSDVASWQPAPRHELPQTTHLSVVDGAGNVVSLTTTLNGSFGCGVLVPRLQILLNNEMDDFAAAPGSPNLYGLVQGEANAVGRGKRMLSSMSPTVAWRGDDVIALGSPGGSRIPTATSQVLLAVVVDGQGLERAVAAPRLHHQWLPDEILAEPGALAAAGLDGLRRRGHAIRSVERLGEVHAVRRTAEGVLEAVADPRGPGSAATTQP
jgi:gamma-glutamyltranspeptidase/glutathione hydrolase